MRCPRLSLEIVTQEAAIASVVIARSEATKQSRLSFLAPGLLRGVYHRARIRATRWLAMTALSLRRALRRLIHRRDRELRAFLDAGRPARGDRLGLGVEADRIRAVLVEIAEAGLLPAAEGVIGDRHRDRHVDADHADIDLGREVARGVAVAGEDRNAVAVVMIRRQRQRFRIVLGA